MARPRSSSSRQSRISPIPTPPGCQPRPVRHLLPGLAGLVVLGLAGLVVPAGQAGEISATGGGLSLGTRVNGQLGGSCTGGVCAIGGGTAAGSNLFHRFSSFDTRGGIRSVLFDTQGQRHLVVGVVNPLGSFLDKPIQFSSPASLTWLSPGGIHLGGGGGFINIPSLRLSTATGLRVGGGLFDALGTTAAQAAQLSGTPIAGRAGLVSDPASLAAASLSANGDVSVSGGLITVDHELLLDAQGGHVLLQGAQIQAPAISVSGRSIVQNGGSLEASSASGAGGTVSLQAGSIQHGGAIHADGASGGGTVAVQATSQLTATGEVSARGLGATAKGGTIELTAPSVSVQGATADASGAGGGGAVRIGGGYQGSALSQGGSNAISTSVDAGTTLRADATGRGDGGQVVVWSEKATQVDGTITARGGSQGGNGGLVETSSKGQLVVTRSPDASAPQGKGGTWLLDPNNLTINASGPDSNVSVAPGSPLGVSTTGDNAVIAASTITTALNAGTSVTLSTGGGGSPGAQAGNISVNAAINKVAGVEASLTLNAANAININAPITSNNSVLNLNLNGATANVAATTMVPGTQQGTINLNFGTLDLGSTSTTLANGASLGFARIEGSNAQLNIASNGQATLDVSVLGPGLTVNVPGSSTLVATGGLGLTGSTINLNGNNSTLRLLGAGVQSLYGPGEMSLTGSQGFVVGADTPLNFASESTFITATGPAASLRIGPGVTVRQSSTQGFGRILNISNLSSNEGTLVMEGRNSMTVSGGSWTNTGALRATSGTLNINSSNWSNSGTGLIEAAGGTVNASSTPFTQSGTLKLSSNGQILLPASFTNNGTISGSGTLKLGDGTGALTNQGTIAPGGVGSVGTLRFTGSLNLGAGSQLLIDALPPITPGGAYQADSVLVSGAIALGGGITLGSGSLPDGTTIKPLTSTSGAITGSVAGGSLPIGMTTALTPEPAPLTALNYQLTQVCQGYCWTAGGGTDTLWSTASNWLNNLVPGGGSGAGEKVYLSAYPSVTLNDSRTIEALYSSSGNSLSILPGGSLTILGSSQVSSLAGGVAIDGGSLSVYGQGAQVNGLRLSSGSLTGSQYLDGPVTLQGSGNSWSGGAITQGYVVVANGATLSLDGASKSFGNVTLVTAAGGRMNWTSGDILTYSNSFGGGSISSGSRSLINAGTFDIRGDLTWTHDPSQPTDVTLPITNTGILVKSAGSGIARLGDSVVIGGATYSNTVDLFNASAGVVDVQSGSLNLSNGYFNQFGTLNVHSGASLARGLGFTNNGTIRGSGSLDLGSGTLTNAGTISPGGSGTAGTLTLNGNLALGSTSQLQIDLLGSTPAANDKLVVNGSASIGGTLTATLAPGYTPLAGATAGDILTATSLSGSFATNNLPTDVSGTTLNPPVMVTPTYRLSKAAPVAPCAGVCWDGGGGDNLWSTATNWNLDVLPGSTDTAYLNLLGGASVLFNGGNVSIAALFSEANNSLTISGGVLTLNDHSLSSNLQGALTVAGGDLVLNNASVALRDLTLSAGSVTGTAAVTVSSNLQQAAGTTLSVGSLNATQELGVMRLDGALSVIDPSGGSGGGGSIGPGGGDGSTLLAAALIGAAAGPVSPPPGLSLSAPSGGLEIGGSLSSPTSLSLSGTGSAGVDNAYGIWLKPGSSLSADGPLSIDGIAGGGVATSEGIGVLLQGNINAQGGLFISGQGGDGLDHNVGVLQSAGASIAVAGSSGLTINGSAVASGGQNRGVELHGLTSVAGAPSTITGYGSAYASGSGNSGVLITGSLSSNYGPTTAISVTGHGGSGSHGLDGVRILGNGMGSAESGSPQISTPNGGIDLSGTGGSVNAPNAAELFGGTGVLLDLAATLEGARITVYGEGAAIDEAFSPAGGSTMVSQGLWVNHRSALLSSGGQALEGVARTTPAESADTPISSGNIRAIGIAVEEGSLLRASGSADLTLDGRAAGSPSSTASSTTIAGILVSAGSQLLGIDGASLNLSGISFDGAQFGAVTLADTSVPGTPSTHGVTTLRSTGGDVVIDGVSNSTDPTAKGLAILTSSYGVVPGTTGTVQIVAEPNASGGGVVNLKGRRSIAGGTALLAEAGSLVGEGGEGINTTLEMRSLGGSIDLAGRFSSDRVDIGSARDLISHASISASGAAASTLQLHARDDLYFGGSLSSLGGPLNAILTADEGDNNTGRIRLDNPTINLSGGLARLVSYDTSALARLDLSGQTLTIQGASQVQAGALSIKGGVKTVVGTTVMDAGSRLQATGLTVSNGNYLSTLGSTEISGDLAMTYARLSGSGNLTINGNFAFTGYNDISRSGVFKTKGNSAPVDIGAPTENRLYLANNATWVNEGTLSLIDNGRRSVVDFGGSGEQTSTLRNAPSGVINTSGDVLLEGLDGVLQNEGRINVASGALFADSLSIEQSGTLSIAAGSTFGKRDNDTYPASQIGTLTNRIGAVIEGAGTIDLGTITVLSPDLGKKGTLTNAGTISPGTATAPGTLTINGNLVLAPTSQLPMDLFGSGSTPAGSDKLVVNGATTLGGSLNVSLASGYTPPVGFSADLGTASDFAGSSGSFSSTSLPPGFTGSVINPPAAPVLTYRISNGAPPPPCAGVCWVGGNGNLWSTDANWNVGHVPLPSDTAYLNLLGGASVPVLLNDARTIAALFSDAGNTLTIASGGSLTLAGHSVLNGDLALQNGGSLTINPSTTATLNGGFSQTGGSLDGAGTLTLASGSNTWSGGSWKGAGLTEVAPGAHLAIAAPDNDANPAVLQGRSVRVRDGASASLAAYLGVDGGTNTLTIDSGASLSFVKDLGDYSGVLVKSGGLTLNQAGSLQLATGMNTVLETQAATASLRWNGSGATTLGPGSALSLYTLPYGTDLGSGGVVATLSGPLSVPASARLSSTSSGLTITPPSASALQFDGTLAVNAGSTRLNTAAIPVASIGSLVLLDGTLVLDAPLAVSAYSQKGGSLQGYGSLEVLRSYERTGGSIAPSLSAVSINQAAGDLRVADLTASGPLSLRAEAGSLNLAGNLRGSRILASGAAGLNLASGTRLTADQYSGVTLQLASGSGAFTNSAGSSALQLEDDASWQVFSASPLTPGENLGGLVYAFKQYGKAFGDATPVAASGNALFYAFSPSLVASLSGSTSKVYDGGVSAVVDPAQLRVSGVMPGDTVNLASTGPAVFASREVGSGKSVTLAGVSVASAFEGPIPVYGYQVAGGSASAPIGTITPATVFGSFLAADKVYDGGTAAGISGRSLTGVLPGDQVSLEGGNIHFLDAAVGTGKPVVGDLFTLAGADRGNYTLSPQPYQTTASINPAFVIGSFTASDKVFDGGTAAAISGRSLSGVLAISQVSLEGGSARFLDAAAGTGKEVVGDGFTLAGADRGNYTLSPQPYQTTASITPAFVIGSFTAADKEFDGGTAATILSRGLSGVLAGDQVSLVGGSARFGSPDVGNGKPVFASAFQLSGPAQANYRLRDAQLISFASILAGPPPPPGPGDPGIREVPYYPIFQALQLNPLIEVPSSGQPLPGPGAAQVPAAQLVGAVEMARNPASDLGGYLDGTAPVPDRAPAPPMVRSGAPMDLQNPQGPYRDQEAKASAMAGELGLKKSPADLEPPSSESLQEWLRRNAATVRQGVSAP